MADCAVFYSRHPLTRGGQAPRGDAPARVMWAFKWHCDCYIEGLAICNLRASCCHDTVACTLKGERSEAGRIHVLFVERVANKTPHTCKECHQRVRHKAVSSWFEQYTESPPRVTPASDTETMTLM